MSVELTKSVLRQLDRRRVQLTKELGALNTLLAPAPATARVSPSRRPGGNGDGGGGSTRSSSAKGKLMAPKAKQLRNRLRQFIQETGPRGITTTELVSALRASDYRLPPGRISLPSRVASDAYKLVGMGEVSKGQDKRYRWIKVEVPA